RSSMADTASKVAALGGEFKAVAADLANTGAAGPMLDRVWDESGPLDGLVNNAGIIRRADAVDLTETDWDDVIDVNLKMVFLLSQSFA
ncbi:MAG: SDR family NAD(P)-dependent oxidoreductase, partial [Mesorhizobium sp.]